MVPIGTCGQPKESLFVEQAILKGKRREKATAMKTLKRGWDYIVTFRVIFSYNVSYTLGPKVWSMWNTAGQIFQSVQSEESRWNLNSLSAVTFKMPGMCVADTLICLCRLHCQRSRDREPRKRDLVPAPIFLINTRTRLQGLAVSPAWRLDREMRRQLILQETWFTR